MAPENIYIIGTSSAGKTSLTHQFPKNYKRIRIDDYYDTHFEKCHKKILSTIKNKFYLISEIDNQTWRMFDSIMVKDIKKSGKSIIDDVRPGLLKASTKHNRIAILLYAPLKDMVRNIHSRRAVETRDLRAFEQFPGLYTATCDPKKAIDIIDRQSFIKDLASIKWLFSSQQHLESFAIGLFQKIGIVTDESYMIRVKEPLYDFVVNTKDKSTKDIYNEIKNLVKTF